MDKHFTPVPFWFWNDELSKDEIKRQILEMKNKGVEGFVIHPRKGLPKSIKYMGPEYLDFVGYAVDLAKENDMIVVLYDEAMYPSGSAHGEVVKKDPSFASKGLEQVNVNGTIKYNVVFSGGNIRGVHENEDDGEEFAPKSADLLNPNAVKTFIELTHEKYYEALKPYFGSTIKAIFTDEPCILGRNPKPGLIPWTDGFINELKENGFDESWLKYLFSPDGSDESIKANRIYKTSIHKRMAIAYYSELSNWCKAHGIGLMGHPEKSTDIGYMKYFSFPCQDIVWRFIAPENDKYISGPDSCMGKCSSDAARHRGIIRNGNECFGCCGHLDDPYAFDENDMRWYLNWLFVRGVNLIIPHAFYYSVRGDRGAERPPEVGMHNPFWPHYNKMSSYIKKMSELMTGVINRANIAVLCTYDQMSDKIARVLFENQVEFNYLEEELLPECKIENGLCKIAKQNYKILVYDQDFENLASPETMELLKNMKENGVKIIPYTDGKELLDKIRDLKEIFVNAQSDKNGNTYSVKDVRCTFFEKDNEKVLFMTNEGFCPTCFELSVKDSAILSIEDPYTNIHETYGPDKKIISLDLSPYESRILKIK